MLPTQRRQAILAQVREQAAVSAEDLSSQFAVSGPAGFFDLYVSAL